MSMGDADQVAESEGEKEFFALGKEVYADYKDRFIPLENTLIKELSTIQDKGPQSRGRAGAEVRQTFDKNYDLISGKNTMRGADPSSGAAMMGLGDASVEEAGLQTRATTSADQGVDDAYYEGQRSIVGLGVGNMTDSVCLSGVSARLDSNLANIKAQAESYEKSAMYGAVGTVAGAAGARGLEDGWFNTDEVDKT